MPDFKVISHFTSDRLYMFPMYRPPEKDISVAISETVCPDENTELLGAGIRSYSNKIVQWFLLTFGFARECRIGEETVVLNTKSLCQYAMRLVTVRNQPCEDNEEYSGWPDEDVVARKLHEVYMSHKAKSYDKAQLEKLIAQLKPGLDLRETLRSLKELQDKQVERKFDGNDLIERAKKYVENRVKGNPKVLAYILDVLNNPEFQKDQYGYYQKWVERRGGTHVNKFPEDPALKFFHRHYDPKEPPAGFVTCYRF